MGCYILEDFDNNQDIDVREIETNARSFDDVKELASENKFDEAIELVKKKFTLTGDMICHFEFAKLYIKKHNYDEAVKHLLFLTDGKVVKPYHVYYKLCICYFNLKKYSESFDCGVKAYEYDERQEKKEDYIYYMVVSSANNSKRFQEGLSFIKKYPCYEKHNTINQILNLYHELKMNDMALETIKNKDFVAENDYDKTIIAAIYYEIGQVDKALNILNSMDRLNNSALLLKGKIEYRHSNYAESENIYDLLVKKRYRTNETVYWLIKSQIRLGKIEEAKSNLKFMSSNLSKTKVLKATLYIYSNELDKAESILEKLSEKDEKYRIVSLIYLASIDIRKGKYSDALNILGFVFFNYKNELDKYTLTNMTLLITIAKNKIGLETQKTSYMSGQIIDYSADTTLERVNASSEKYNFFPGLDLEATFYKLQELIANEYPKICACSNVCDTYLVDFPSAGILNDKILDKMQVVTIIGTKDIISFYPVSELSYKKSFDNESTEPADNVKRLAPTENINYK